MHHDPEHTSAAYLAGELSRRARARFERHMLDCDTCWDEAAQGRSGRMIAESLRELAPPSLRDRVRAVPEDPPDPAPRRRGRGRLLAAAAAVVFLLLAGMSAVMVLGGEQPAPLAQAASLLHAQHDVAADRAITPPISKVGGYQWRTSGVVDLGGVKTTVHTYSDPAGHRLLVLASDVPFPRARDARPIDPEPSWLADIDGATMLCVDRAGISWLAVGRDRTDALIAGRELGLT